MKKYKTLLFDLDDTIFDFQASEIAALKTVLKREGITNLDYVISMYHAINKELWTQFENNKITIKDIYSIRFKKLSETLNISFSDTIENDYQVILGNQVFFLENAYAVLEALHNKYTLYIITNGIAFVQHIRINKSGIKQFFADIFISEEIGFQKPSIDFFTHVLNNIPYTKKECLIIGDSMSSDIAGGFHSGIDSCWLNRHRAISNIPHQYEIKTLKDLLTFL